MVELGGWAITEQVYGLIRYLLPSKSTLLEFGSGEGTALLTRNYQVHSVEHDENYVGAAPMSNYIHAPIKEIAEPVEHVWYDPDIVRAAIPSDYDLILIDGPTGVIGRGGMIHHLDMLNLDVPLLVDDVNRMAERRLALQIADRIGAIPVVFGEGKRECALLFRMDGEDRINTAARTAMDTANHRLRIGPFEDETDAYEFRSHLETNFNWIIYTRRSHDNGEDGYELVTGTFHGLGSVIQRAIALKSSHDHDIEILTEMMIPEPDLGEVSGYDPNKLWRQEGRMLFLQTPWEEIHFEMPDSWLLDRTHPDLFKVAEFVLMHPWVDGILDDWEPSRTPGSRPGLAFSGGIDSAAAMLLMPPETVLIYNERDFESALKHENAFRFIEHLEAEHDREVIRVKSNHERIRTHHGKAVGFSTDYACAIQVILLADHLDLDSMATGMPLENAYLYHGHRYRDLGQSWFWRLYGRLFQSIGLPIFQPVAGCSEIINHRIVEMNGLIGYAQSCLRSTKPGEVCGRCWKCFRKNTTAGHDWEMSPEIDQFLRKEPMKQAASTIFAFQKMAGWGGRIPKKLRGFPQVERFWGLDLTWLDQYLASSLDLLPPQYISTIREQLEKYAEPMTEPLPILGFELYPK